MARTTEKAATAARGARRRMSLEHRFLWSRAAVFAGLFLFILVFGLLPGTATFTVNAKTKSLELVLRPEDRFPAWGKASAILDVFDQTVQACGDVSFEPNPARKRNLPVRVGIRDEPPLQDATSSADQATGLDVRRMPVLVATFNEEPEALGTLRCDGKATKARAPFALLFRPKDGGDGIAVPFIGLMRLGGDIAAPIAPDPPGQPAVLLDGTLTIEATAWPFPTGRARTQVELNMGDVVTLVGDHDDARRFQPAAGVIRTVATPFEDSSLQVVAQGDAIEAKVDSSYQTGKTAGYAPTFWARIEAMGQWAAILALATLVLGLLEVARDIAAARAAER